jgi:hypothetical protein
MLDVTKETHLQHKQMQPSPPKPEKMLQQEVVQELTEIKQAKASPIKSGLKSVANSGSTMIKAVEGEVTRHRKHRRTKRSNQHTSKCSKVNRSRTWTKNSRKIHPRTGRRKEEEKKHVQGQSQRKAKAMLDGGSYLEDTLAYVSKKKAQKEKFCICVCLH